MFHRRLKVELPPGAKLVKATKTKGFKTEVYAHIIGGFIVDGDRLVVKQDRRTKGIKITERIWNEPPPPPPAPKKPQKEAKAVLINPDDPFYQWEDKPPKYHPCWLVQKGAELKVIDMMTGKTIGKGTPVPGG